MTLESRNKPGPSGHGSDAFNARASCLVYVCLCIEILTFMLFCSFSGVLQLDIVRTMVEYGANVNARNHTGFTPLFWATGNSVITFVK